MKKYRKKPVVIEAKQWFNHGDDDDVYMMYPKNAPNGRKCTECGCRMDSHGHIDTLEGGHIVCPNDWIIIEIENEKYPCKPYIFEQTYEEVK